jgi:hypothetical protein
MRSVRSLSFWTCACGTRYRAVTEINRAASKAQSASVECHTCRKRLLLEGKLTSLSYEFPIGTWIDVPVVTKPL